MLYVPLLERYTRIVCALFLSRSYGVVATTGIVLNLFVIKVQPSGPKPLE
jgi:hypothetical protein